MTTETITIDPRLLKNFKGGNTRRQHDDASFAELVENIKNQGIIQLPVVRLLDDETYEVVCGHRRRDAAIQADLSEIKVEVRILSDTEAMEVHLAENLIRKDLDFIDQIEAAKRFVSFYKGDRDSAAKRLGWSLKKLTERLELVNCTDDVLAALNDGSISAGHALILSTMPEKLQNGSVKTIINEKLTVAELRQRASKVRIPLSTATFDKSDCQGCKHNSELQAGLFGSEDDSATCANLSCYRAKTQSQLSTQRKELEERFGKVLFLTESLASDRNTVDAVNVGTEQFNNGCMSCENRAVILDDRPTREGNIIESQCLDAACFNKCVGDFKNRALISNDTPDKEAVNDANASTQAPKKKESESATKAAKASAYQPSNAVIECHKAEIANFGREFFVKQEQFRWAYLVISVEQLSGAQGSARNAASRIKELISKPVDELKQLLSKTMQEQVMSASTFGGYSAFEFFKNALVGSESKDAAIENWKPSEATLKAYTIEGIVSVCTGAKLDKSMDKEDKGAFKKLSTSGKGALIQGVLAAEHDWTSFAPAAFIKVLSS